MHRILSSLLLPCALVLTLFSTSVQRAEAGELARPQLRMLALYYMNSPLVFTFLLKNANPTFDLGPVYWTIYVYYVQTNICMYTLSGQTTVNKGEEVEVTPPMEYEPAEAGQYRVEVRANSEVNISGEQIGTATVEVLAPPGCSTPPTRTPSGGMLVISEGNTVTYTAPVGCCYHIDPFINTGVFYSVSPSTRQTISNGQSVTFTVTATDPNPAASVIGFAYTECENGSPAGKEYIVVAPTRLRADTSVQTTPYGSGMYIGVFGDPVSPSSGQFVLHEKPDIEFASSPISFSRMYDGGAMNAGVRPSLGLNWSHSYSSHVFRDREWCYVQLANGCRYPFEKVGSAWVFRGIAANAHLQETNNGWIATDVTHGMQYTFNAEGLLTKQDNGRQPVFVNWINGALSSVSDSLGHILMVTTDSLARITKIEDGTRTVRYTHTPKNEVMFSTSMTGNISTYTYDANVPGRLTHVRRGGSVTPIIINEYNGAGRVIRQTNSLGKIWTYSYESSKATVTDPDGTIEEQQFNGRSRLTSAGPVDEQVVLQYNTQGYATQITNAEGDVATYAWHVSGRPASVTNSDGTTQYAYVARPWNGATAYDLTKITNADGSSRTYTLDAKGLATEVMDENGNKWQFSYDLKTGKEIEQLDPTGVRLRHHYGTNGHLTKVDHPSGSSTIITTNAEGNITKAKYADASEQDLTYDRYGRLITVVDETERTTRWEYDDRDRITRLTLPSNTVTEWMYDAENRVASVKSPRNGTTTFGYTDAGRLMNMKDPMNGVMTWKYDEEGRIGSLTDRAGSEYKYDYDQDGNLISTTLPSGGITRFTRDERGRMTGVLTPLGLQYSHEIDNRGLLSRSTDPNGRTVSYEYDNVGRLTRQSIAGDLTISHNHDAAGKPTTVTDPRGFVWGFQYGADRTLRSLADPEGRVVSYTYNNRDRVTRIQLPGAAGSATMLYDAAGRLTNLSYSDGVLLHYSYNLDGRIVGTEKDTCTFDADGNITMSNGIVMERNLNGWITKLSYGVGKDLMYVYDASGRIASITDWRSGTTRYTHNADGNLTQIQRPNGVNTTYTRDADGRVTKIDEGSIASTTLSYGSGNRIVSAERTGQLENVVKSDWSATYDDGNVRTDLGYDDAGRTTSADSLTITWDVASRLRAVSGKLSATVAYDGFGRPTAVVAGATTRSLVWNDAFGEGLPGIVRTPISAMFVVPTPGGSVAYVIDSASGARFYPHYSESGNTLIVTNDLGETVLRVAYEPYGAIAAAEGNPVYPFLFGGAGGVVMINENVALTAARAYHAKAGRFLSPDPIRSLHPMRINPFQYAQCDPINMRDWTGRAPEPAPRSIDEIIDASNRRLEEANRETQERYERDMRKHEEEAARRRADRESRERAERESRERLEEEQRREAEELRKDKEAFDRAWRKANEMNEVFMPMPTEPATPTPAPGTGEGTSTPGTQGSGSNTGGNGQPPSSGGTRTRPPAPNPPPTTPGTGNSGNGGSVAPNTPAGNQPRGPRPPQNGNGGIERGHYSEPGSSWWGDFFRALFGCSN